MNFDHSYFYSLATDILMTPSPSGYTQAVIEKIATYATALGLSAIKSTKGNLIVTFEGLDSTKVLEMCIRDRLSDD